MSNTDAARALIAAINFDQFARIEALHQPDVTFWPFPGPAVLGSVSVQDWYKEFLRDYSDCLYTEEEVVEDGDVVAIRATLEAKGYDWRQFTQRVLDVCEMHDGKVASRRLYAMLPNLELDKAATAAMTGATGFRGGSPSETKKVVEAFMAAVLSGQDDAASACIAEKAALLDNVFGNKTGAADMVAGWRDRAKPGVGTWQVTGTFCGPRNAVVETSVNAARPRRADWLRIVDGKIGVVETYWMLREIGIGPEARTRHLRRVIHPM
ncbi:MAG: nuclear transport factor 2 family protein [Dehalococcoidia bacterium]|nr:nuclear transport factor 2 family protein [Chloroflexi bacterium CFX7]NUQ56358.1 nuclear transport factor 2 family protein [Dehalococcoidia bacterium]